MSSCLCCDRPAPDENVIGYVRVRPDGTASLHRFALCSQCLKHAERRPGRVVEAMRREYSRKIVN